MCHGRATADNQLACIKHFRQNVLAELHQIGGFSGASLFTADRSGAVAFLVITRWFSGDAIRASAGDDITKAVVEPEAQRALLDFDKTVQDWEIVEEFRLAPGQDV
jgi:hypothetical protein